MLDAILLTVFEMCFHSKQNAEMTALSEESRQLKDELDDLRHVAEQAVSCYVNSVLLITIYGLANYTEQSRTKLKKVHV